MALDKPCPIFLKDSGGFADVYGQKLGIIFFAAQQIAEQVGLSTRAIRARMTAFGSRLALAA